MDVMMARMPLVESDETYSVAIASSATMTIAWVSVRTDFNTQMTCAWRSAP